MTNYTLRKNTHFNSLEISFSEKPAAEIRDILKGFRFRWNHTLKIWYGFRSEKELRSQLDKALLKDIETVKKTFTKKLTDQQPVKVEKIEKPAAKKTTKKAAAKTELKPEKKPATEKPAASYYKMPGINKLKKAVMNEKQPCIMVVDKKDNSIIAKLPAGSSTEKYDRFQYCFYTIH